MKRAPNIIQAIKNPKLFGSLPKFKCLNTWRAWLVVLRAIFCLPLTADDLLVFQKLTGRVSPPLDGAKETYIIAGRRSGKSFMTALIAVFVSCFGDFKEFITVGETLAVLCLARDKDQARIVFRYVKAILRAVPVLRGMIVAERGDEIELTTGVAIMVKANDFRGVRGLTLCCVIADEICFWDAIGANPDREVLAAVRPATMTIPTSKLLCISSAYAQSGVMFDARKEYYGKDTDEILVVQAETSMLNPTVSEDLIQREIERDPEAGRSEWLGLFRDDVSAAFSLEMIESCIVPGRVQLPAMTACAYVGFTDASGGRRDQFVTTVAHLSDDKVILDAICATKPPFSPTDTVKEHADFLKSYGVTGTRGDAYAGEWPREQFAKNGVGYEVSDKNKSELYLNLIPVMTSKRVELLDDDKLKNELRRLERRRGRSGRDSIDHLPRLSDDVANSVAGVVYLTLEQSGDVMPESYGDRTVSDWKLSIDQPFFTSDRRGRFWDS